MRSIYISEFLRLKIEDRVQRPYTYCYDRVIYSIISGVGVECSIMSLSLPS